jgi:ATP-dependent DNA helicase RecG
VAAVAETNDGFILAQTDLNMRSEGDVLGTKQSGRNTSLKLLRVALDGEILQKARDYAQSFLTADPELSKHQGLKLAIAALTETQQANLIKA